jgi:phosphoribosylglycinamide formyltransferase 1
MIRQHNPTKLRIAVLISGGGTNLQALLDRAAAGQLAAEIVAVLSDRADAYGLVRAEKAGVPTHVVDYRGYLGREVETPLELELPVDLEELAHRQHILKIPDRDKLLSRLARLVLAEGEMIRVLDRYQPDYVCLAGFMRLLSPYFLSHYNRGGQWRVVNIHPALLPAFPGAQGYEDTCGYGCKWGGITVHFADEGEDTGPIIAQAVYPIWPDDDLERVRRRGLSLEYELYAQCINWLAAGQVEIGSGSTSRISTRITDPHYQKILKTWIDKALGASGEAERVLLA